jgi:hypothetical protein
MPDFIVRDAEGSGRAPRTRARLFIRPVIAANEVVRHLVSSDRGRDAADQDAR